MIYFPKPDLPHHLSTVCENTLHFLGRPWYLRARGAHVSCLSSSD